MFIFSKNKILVFFFIIALITSKAKKGKQPPKQPQKPQNVKKENNEETVKMKQVSRGNSTKTGARLMMGMNP